MTKVAPLGITVMAEVLDLAMKTHNGCGHMSVAYVGVFAAITV